MTYNPLSDPGWPRSRTIGDMTLATPHPGRRPAASPSEVFASGSSVGRRRVLVAGGCALLALGYFCWLFGEFWPSLTSLTGPAALFFGAFGLIVLSLTLWRRSEVYQVRANGILLIHGGPLFGDRQLVPWGSITHFGGRRAGADEICLAYRQQHMPERKLPGHPLTEQDFDRMIDRLRVVLGSRYPHLELGGVE